MNGLDDESWRRGHEDIAPRGPTHPEREKGGAAVANSKWCDIFRILVFEDTKHRCDTIVAMSRMRTTQIKELHCDTRLIKY